MSTLSIAPFAKAMHKGQFCEIIRQVNLTQVLVRYAPHQSATCVPVVELAAVPDPDVQLSQLLLFSSDEAAYSEAQRRFDIIKPLLARASRTTATIKDLTRITGSSESTLWRWLKLWDEWGTLAALMPRRRARLGVSGLRPEVDEIIARTIDEIYMVTPKPPKKRVVVEVRERCRRASLPVPGKTVIHNRISATSEAKQLKAHSQDKKRRDQLVPRVGHFDEAVRPLELVQIDHSPADIILVDEQTRQPMGERRPILSVALDLCTRAIVGFYLSLDGPDAVSVGMTMTRSVCRKEAYLHELGLESSWPVWGMPKTLHLDNAKEFRSEALARAAAFYNFNLRYRPIRTPHFGGHVERVIRTLQHEVIHELPGTTVSNPAARGSYDSVENAALTIRELEILIAKWITEQYNCRTHGGINMSPLRKWESDCIGTAMNPGIGTPPFLSDDDEAHLALHFLPGFRRVLDNRGIVIDHIWYYHDVFASLLMTRSRPKSQREYLFRRDPRDISKVYFFDEEQQVFYTVPCRDVARPSVSVYEWRQAIERLRTSGKSEVDEQAIFAFVEQTRDFARQAKERTAAARIPKRGRRISERPIGTLRERTEEINVSEIEPFLGVEFGWSGDD